MAEAVRTDLVQGTDEWLAARRDGIGSSDAPVIAGESPYRGAYALWAEKTGLAAPEEPDAAQARLFRIGHLMEPVLLEMYEAETGRRTRREPRMLRHPSVPWMTASLDASVPGEPVIVECKWTNAARWRGAEDGIPADVLAQVQHAMAVTGAERADVVALVGSELRIVPVPRDDAYIADLMALEADFRRRVVERDPPEPDGSDATRRALSRAHPRPTAGLLPASPDVEALVRELAARKAAAREAEQAIGSIENALRALVGDAEGLEGPWGQVTWRRNADSARVNWPAIAAAHRARLESLGADPAELAAVESEHTETVQGPRVLRTRLARESS